MLAQEWFALRDQNYIVNTILKISFLPVFWGLNSSDCWGTYSNHLGSNLINLYYYWSSNNLEYCWFERQLCDLMKLAREPLLSNELNYKKGKA